MDASQKVQLIVGGRSASSVERSDGPTVAFEESPVEVIELPLPLGTTLLVFSFDLLDIFAPRSGDDELHQVDKQRSEHKSHDFLRFLPNPQDGLGALLACARGRPLGPGRREIKVRYMYYKCS